MFGLLHLFSLVFSPREGLRHALPVEPFQCSALLGPLNTESLPRVWSSTPVLSCLLTQRRSAARAAGGTVSMLCVAGSSFKTQSHCRMFGFLHLISLVFSPTCSTLSVFLFKNAPIYVVTPHCSSHGAAAAPGSMPRSLLRALLSASSQY